MREPAVAKRGETQFLIRPEGKDGTIGQTAQVFDRSTGRVHRRMRVQSLLARGYWVPTDEKVEVPAEPTA